MTPHSMDDHRTCIKLQTKMEKRKERWNKLRHKQTRKFETSRYSVVLREYKRLKARCVYRVCRWRGREEENASTRNRQDRYMGGKDSDRGNKLLHVYERHVE